jgi:hypothetical protein
VRGLRRTLGDEFDLAWRAEAQSAFEQNGFDAPSLYAGLSRVADDSYFASRNFGIPAIGNQGTIVPGGSQIEQLCLLNNVGRSRVIDVAGVAESICASLANGVQRRFSTLIFFSKIVRVLTDERRISPTSLIYLEQTIGVVAGR